MKTVYLIDLFKKPMSGEWGKEPEEGDETVGVIRTTNFSDDIRIDKNSEIVRRVIREDKVEKKKLISGDIIIEKSGGSPNQPVGRILYYELNSDINLCNNFTAILRPRLGNNSKYLAYLLYWLYNRKEVLKYQNKTTGIINLKLNMYLKSTKVNIPPLQTQKKIVEVLDKAQELIDLRKKQIGLLDELIQSIFYDMFGDPVINPRKWRKTKLENLCDVYRGGSPRPIKDYVGGTVPWIKIGDATNGDDVYLYSTKEHIIEEGVKKSRLVKKGSLIFANCGVSLGFARIIKFDGCIHDGWLSFENIDESIDKLFLLKLLNCYTDYFRKTAPDGTQPNLNTKIMKSFNVIVPPKSLQIEFSKKLNHIIKQKELMQESLFQMEDNFNSLMQKAFKGELFS